MTAPALSFDLAAAVKHNAKALGLAPLADKTEERLAIALAFWQEEHGLEPDGAYDRATEESLNTARHDLEDLVEPESVELKVPLVQRWPAFDWRIPKGTLSASVLGTPGPKGSAWHRANIIDLRGLDERTTKTGEPGYTAVHKLIAPGVVEAIRRARIACPDYRIRSVGGYVYRRIRHSKTGPLSKHAWGAAIDINSNENFGKTFDVDEDGPEPWSAEWNAIWPNGMPRAFVEAIESTGMTWGGRWPAPKGKHGYRDPMHFQAPKRF